MRTVTIRANDSLNNELPEFFNEWEVKKAIGYLSTWAITNERYCKVNLWVDKDKNIHASYQDKNGKENFAMMGLREEYEIETVASDDSGNIEMEKNVRYSFHS